MKVKFYLIVVLSAVVTAAAFGADGTNLRRFGLFVGSNDGGRERVTLAYAASDALTVKSVMEEVGGVAVGDGLLLRDPDSTELALGFDFMRDAIARAKQTNRRVEFVLYYSGHSDEFGILLGGERFSYLDLRNHIQTMGADVNIAILDSCSSGAFTRLKGGSRQAPFLVDESVTTKGHAFITSSSETEAAQESDSIGASFFTHYFVSGLRGAADSTQDGKVSLNEAYTYAFEETLTRTSTTLAGPQHAGHEFSLAGAGDLVLTDLRIASAGVVFASDVTGRMFVNQENGRLVAEIRKEAGTELTLALPPGRYLLTLDTNDGLMEGALDLDANRRVSVDTATLRMRTPEVARERGNGATPTPGSQTKTDTGLSEEPGELWIFGERVDPDVAATIERSLVHLNRIVSLAPDFSQNGERRVIHDFSLKFVGGSYRVEGIDLGLMSFVQEDVKGAQITAIGGFVGDDLYGAQLSGVFNINGGRVFGGQGAGVFNIADGRIYGGQGAGVFNIAGGDVQSVQAAGVFNIASGTVQGVQGAGVLNIADGRVRGAQLAGVFNIAEGEVRGAQAAGVFNINEGDLRGFQGAGLFNIAEGELSGLQASGLFSISEDDLRGVQASSLFNVADDINGAQIALVNIGGAVRGTQIGLINVSEAMFGVPIGLINISGNGLFNPSVWSDDTGYTYGGMQIGAGPFYSLAYAGTSSSAPWSSVALGFGAGLHLTLGAAHLDVDLSAKSYATGASFDEALRNSALEFYRFGDRTWQSGDLSRVLDVPVYPSIRVHAGFTIFRSVAILGGLTLEGLASPHQLQNEYFHRGDPWIVPFEAAGNLSLYPRWFFGIRI